METSKIKQFFSSILGRVTVTVVGAIIIYGILFWALESNNTTIMCITLLSCAVFGWKALNKITPNIFLIGTTNFWIGYFLIKGFLSIMIGGLIAPFQIAKMISNKLAQPSTEDY